MGLPLLITVILWLILSACATMNYISCIKDLNKIELLFFIIIFLIDGPIFAANNILTMLLDNILPEGWDDDDNSEN